MGKGKLWQLVPWFKKQKKWLPHKQGAIFSISPGAISFLECFHFPRNVLRGRFPFAFQLTENANGTAAKQVLKHTCVSYTFETTLNKSCDAVAVG